MLKKIKDVNGESVFNQLVTNLKTLTVLKQNQYPSRFFCVSDQNDMTQNTGGHTFQVDPHLFECKLKLSRVQEELEEDPGVVLGVVEYLIFDLTQAFVVGIIGCGKITAWALAWALIDSVDSFSFFFFSRLADNVLNMLQQPFSPVSPESAVCSISQRMATLQSLRQLSSLGMLSKIISSLRKPSFSSCCTWGLRLSMLPAYRLD